MSKIFYRFRSTDRLLKENELKKQSIYFASPEQLNDPMEGFRDLYWQGDTIVWTNLFKHYLLCLEHVCCLYLIGGETQPIADKDIPVFIGEMDLPTPKYKELFSDMYNSFATKIKLTDLVDGICSRTTPIRRDELFFYLKLIHGTALEVIYEAYANHGCAPKGNVSEDKRRDVLGLIKGKKFFELTEQLLREHGTDKKVTDALFAAHSNAVAQMDIILRYKDTAIHDQKNKVFLFLGFSEAYINQLEQLTFPQWYTACFMSKCDNSAVWGNYGYNHTGICLMFKAEQEGNDFYIDVKGITGWGGDGAVYGIMKQKFHPVNYVKGYGEIDFFKSIGRLPHGKLHTTWYAGDGKRSACADAMTNNEEEWRRSYWEKFLPDLQIKTKDWAYEDESRLILTSMLGSFSKKEDRALTYEFNSLHGLIFGIKTSMDDKISIMKIIEQKCRETGRKDFKFHQARYSHENSCIEFSELSLLTFA
jgi:hypothetical protein